MLSNLRVPGVYVQEISTLPASVAAVPTAVPAFLGYTEISSEELRAEPVRIENLLEYEATFGRGPGVRITNVAMTPRDTLDAVTASLDYYLYESVRLFYANGGGVCYVLSVGAFRDDNQVVNTDFLPGADPDANFKKLASIDEITLLGAPDAVRLSAAELGNLQQQMIRHCSDQQDRFAVLDLKQTEAEPIGVDIDAFRNGTGVSTLSYAAAYAPYLRIRPLQHYTLATLSNVVLSQGGADTTVGNYVSGLAGDDPALAATHLNATRWSTILSLQTAYVADINDAGNQDALVAAINEMATAFNIDLTDGNTPERYLPLFNYRQSVLDNAQPAEVTANYEATTPVLDFLSGAETALRNAIPAYRELVTAAEAGLFDLPPSGAVLGVYAGTDDRRGVWKAPANVSHLRHFRTQRTLQQQRTGGHERPPDRQEHQRHPCLSRKGDTGLRRPHARRAGRGIQVRTGSPAPHFPGGEHQKSGGTPRLRTQRCQYLDPRAGHDRELPQPSVAGRCPPGGYPRRGLPRRHRPGQNDDRRRRHQRADDREYLPGSGTAGGVYRTAIQSDAGAELVFENSAPAPRRP